MEQKIGHPAALQLEAMNETAGNIMTLRNVILN